MREIILDTETTGFDPQSGHRVIEIGCVELINHLPTGEVFHSYLNPERDIPEDAFEVHGLSAEFLADKPLFAQVAEEFLAFIGDAPLVIHYAEFDMRFINAELVRLGRSTLPMSRFIDTVAMARQRFPGAEANLDALCHRFNINTSLRTLHGALLDAELLAKVYLQLVALNPVGAEKEVLSTTYMSAHPLDAYARSMKRLGVLKFMELPRHLQSGGKGQVKLAGSLLSIQERVSAKGSRYAFLEFSDASGKFEVVCFSEVFGVSCELLDAGGPLLIEVDAKLEDGQLRLTCQRVSSLDVEASNVLSTTLRDNDVMPRADFVHLHVHTDYSLGESAIRPKQLVKLCRGMAMPAAAITDTANLTGALKFSTACVDAGIQPIIGCQLAVRREDRGSTRGRRRGFDQLVLLCQNEEGYSNLLRLMAKASWVGGPRGTLQVSEADIASHAAGLIALTGGPAGAVGRLLYEGGADKAEAALLRLAVMFPGRLYVELMRHGMESELRIEPALVELARRNGLPLVATNEPFFADPGMYEAHDVLIRMGERARASLEGRRSQFTPEHYFKSPTEMRALFADLPEACDNTLAIARRCAFTISKRKPILPSFPTDGMTEAEVLRAKTLEGLEKRLLKHVFQPGMTADEREYAAKPYRKRVEFELNVIEQMGFSGYFLIVADFIQWSKVQGILVGPGRGPSASSAVAWALTITEIDPLRWGLLFERFLNPERVSMPYFDIDFCQERRDEVILYVHTKYGDRHVALISGVNDYGGRQLIRSVGRTLQMPSDKLTRLCRKVPSNRWGWCFLLDGDSRLQAASKNDRTASHVVDIAIKLEGVIREVRPNPANIAICGRPIDELVPVYCDSQYKIAITQFRVYDAFCAGVESFVFWPLQVLTALAATMGFIKERKGINIDLSVLPLDDPATYALVAHGDTAGVFQLESSGMRKILEEVKPDRFEDLIAVVALYRPGPMDQIPRYIACKRGQEEPDYM